MYRFVASTNKDISLSDLQVALINFIVAKQMKVNFILRINDIDKENHIAEKDREILDILALCGISYDLLYYQSENFKYHLQFASSLMDKGKAFACFCSEKELEKTPTYSGKCINISQEELLNNNLPFTIRIKKPKKTLHVKNEKQENIAFKADEIDSFVIMSQKKYPTANFASSCDDMIQGISHIIDSKDNLLDAPRQTLIRQTLGYTQEIPFTHLPSLKNGSCSVKALLDEGFLPEAIINYLLSLTMQTKKEIFSLQEAIEFFDLQKISNESIEFDKEKLKQINIQHIKALPDMQVSKIIGYSSNDIGKLAKLFTQEVSTTYEIKTKVDKVFAKKSSTEYEEDLQNLKALIIEAPYFENFHDFEAYLMQKSKLSKEKFSKILQIVFTNEQSSLNLEEIYNLIKHYLQEIAK